MSISDLPDEVLEQIFLERVLSDDESKLASLALVNRSFSRCVRLALYECITIWLSGERYVQLMRTLTEHPQLGSLVHCIFIDLDPYSGHSQPDKRKEQMEVDVARKLASNLLTLLPALSTLEIAAWFPLPAGSWSILDVPIQSLRTARLGGIKFTAAEAARLMLLPNITTLSISFGRHSITERFLPPTLISKPGISSLKSLQFDECLEFGSSLQELLTLPRALESFSCHFGWALEAVSLVTLARGLKPMYPSLIDLSLAGRFRTDGKLLNFRRFECLKHLKVSNSFCFSLDAHDRIRNRQGLYRRLPASLETLQINFVSGYYIAVETKDRWVYNRIPVGGQHDPRDYQVTDYRWILELVENKPVSLPSLRSVTLSESAGDPPSGNYYSVPEDKPRDVAEAFYSAGVHLGMWIRRPYGQYTVMTF